MHKILQNHLLCAFVANLKIGAIYALYPESFCDKNLAIRKVFAFCDSGLILSCCHCICTSICVGVFVFDDGDGDGDDDDDDCSLL